MTDKNANKTNLDTSDRLIGIHLGDYTIQALVGEGGMARVYEGFDPKLGRRAAIKIIDNKHGEDDEATQRFIREARAIASLDHPNIVGVYQFGEAPGLYYLAMKFLEGRTLSSTLKKLRQQKKYMPPDQVVEIIAETAAAIDYAHSHNLIHRDIKPSNIMLTDNNRAILMDFGLTMEVSSVSTLGTAFGTPRYIAPEQAIASHRAVPQSDIYSLGVVLYEMVTGRTPFDDTSPMSLALSHISQPVPDPCSIRPDVPHPVELVILKALEKRPEDRWQTGTAMADALRKAYEGIDPGVKLSDAPPPKPEEFLSAVEAAPTDKDKKKTPSEAKSQRKKPTKEASSPNATPVDAEPKAAAVPAPTPAAVPIKEPPIPIQATRPAGSSTNQPLPVPQPTSNRRRLVIVSALLAMIAIIAIIIIIFATSQSSGNNIVSINASSAGVITPGPTVRLIYDDESFVIYNNTDQVVSLENVIFKRGDVVTHPFEAYKFGDKAHKSLQPSQCLRIKIQTADDAAVPLSCTDIPNTVTFIDTNAVFWTMRDKDLTSTFLVTRNGQTIQTCSLHANTCELSPQTLQQ